MKLYIIFSFAFFQMVNAAEKDSLFFVNSFKVYSAVPVNLLCDACGCAASGGSMGFASMFNSNFIGIRYFNQRYKSIDGLYSNSPWFRENFNTAQIWARVPVAKRLQTTVLAPYHSHNRETLQGMQTINGLGDITIIGMYELHKTGRDSISFSHTFQIGGGIKIPIGKFSEANSGSLNPSYQVGTGSWDYLLTAEHNLKHKKFGLNTMLNYVMKTENQKNYRFGNQLNYASTIFYVYEISKIAFVPQIGIAGEIFEANYQYNQKIDHTAGDIFMGRFGFELGKDKFSFGANAMLPINQNLNGGNVVANYRWSINLNYSL